MNKKCQVFTPHDYVEKLLDCIEYTHGLYGKKIIENSCGDGNILAVIVQRYIDDCKQVGLSRTKIKNGLAKDIYGVEIDPEQYEKCIKRLNSIIAKAGLEAVEWKIFNEDYLLMSLQVTFDYVVGNPPYITYKELNEKNRTYLRQVFISCKKGKFDYCYAFLEKSICSLSKNGKMAYLIPSSVFKTVFGKKIRELMLPFLIKIIDFTQEKLFTDALVKSAIVVLDKKASGNNIEYKDETSKIAKQIKRTDMGDKWCFVNANEGKRRFGDYFKVSHSIATLCNNAFIIKEWKINRKGNYICNGIELEKDMVRRAYSPKLLRRDKQEIIIFPYRYDEKHKLIHLSEQELISNYPGVYDYLCMNRADLDKRDKDDAALWFEYGRSQALSNMDQEKALISTIISNEVLVYKLDRLCIPYSGMYIIAKSDSLSIDEGIKMLLKEDFLKYVQSIGIHINGNSVRITSKDIEEYRF